jgi:hypothetical protein
MEPSDVPEEWLSRANERYKRDRIPPKQRPFLALLEYTREKNAIIGFSSPVALRVFDWFKKRTAPEAHQIGSMFTGSYFFDEYFWPVSIPIGYGRFKLDALASLETMPDALKKDLLQNKDELWVYTLYCADCADYAYGYDDIRKLGTLPPLALSFLENADKELRGAISQLNSPRPNSKAVLAARMATEIFLKAFLIAKRGLTETELKKLRHDIPKITRACIEVSPVKEFEIIESLAHVFPPVEERYVGQEKKLNEVWEALCLSQMSAATVIRHFTDRDLRSQVFASSIRR